MVPSSLRPVFSALLLLGGSLTGCGASKPESTATPSPKPTAVAVSPSAAPPQLEVTPPVPAPTELAAPAAPPPTPAPPPEDMTLPPPLPSAKKLAPKNLPKWMPADVLPFGVQPDVPGTMVAVLWSAGDHAWGSSLIHESSHVPDNHRPQPEYVINGEKGPPYSVYFVSDGRGIDAGKHKMFNLPGNGVVAEYSAARFLPWTPNALGLSRLAHLVEIEVNDKRGASGSVFVITNLRIIDGTPEFPLRVDDLIRGVRARFDVALAAKEAQIPKQFAAITKTMTRELTFEPMKQSHVGVLPRWKADSRTLEVVFSKYYTISGVSPLKTIPRPCPPCPPRAPCIRCAGGMIGTKTEGEVQIMVAARYAIDANGEVVAETQYLPTVIKKRDCQGFGDDPYPKCKPG